MISLITDFGYRDNFVGILKGVIKKINPRVEIVDISHNIKPFSITNGQFVLYSSYQYFPEGTVFCVVIDPGVGTERRGLIAQNDRYSFILPDNGLISAVFSDKMMIYEIDNEHFGNVSATFHGRDIFAPLSAYISQGQSPVKFGNITDVFIVKKFPEYHITDNRFEAEVVHIDRFGNVILSIPNYELKNQRASRYLIQSSGHQFTAYNRTTYEEIGGDTCGVIMGSSGFIELAVWRDSLNMRYGIDIGDRLVLLNES